MKTKTKTFSARPFEQIDMARKKQIAFWSYEGFN